MAPPQFKDDPTRVMHVVVMSVFSFFALVAVILRLWARKIQRISWEVSDYLIVAGLIWGLGLAIFTIHSNIYEELGGDVTQAGNPQAIHALVVRQMKDLLVGQITWSVSVFFIRASVLALYIRIFRIRSFFITGCIVHAVNAAFLASTVLAACLICRPLAYSWDPTIRGGHCGNQKKLDLYIGTFNLLLDITVVVLPMPILWGLQMALSKKVILSAMFSLGIIICAITLVRITISGQNHGSNAQKVYSLVALYTDLEALLGIINACLPVLKPVFVKISTSNASSWLSSVMSGSIPIFMRPSQMGSSKKSNSRTKRSSTRKEPPQKDMPLWTRNQRGADLPADEFQQSLPPDYVDRSGHSMDISATKYPRPPELLKSKINHSTKHWESIDEKDVTPAHGIYVERSFDVDVERGRSVDSDQKALVERTQTWM